MSKYTENRVITLCSLSELVISLRCRLYVAMATVAGKLKIYTLIYVLTEYFHSDVKELRLVSSVVTIHRHNEDLSSIFYF